MTKYLHIPTTVKSKAPPASLKTRAMTGARVLTSSECQAIIKGKELQKKLEEEAKEKRERDREDKEKQQEELKEKKAEVRA